MTTNTIIERATQKPFRPFAVETVGGTWIEVDHENDISVYNRVLGRARVVVFDASGRLYILEPEQISSIEAK